MSRAIVISNGSVDDYDFLKEKIHNDDFVICADGAIRHLIKINKTPDLWIGDFDSCMYDSLCHKYPYLKEIPTKSLNPCKDETDTHICVIEAINRGFNDIVILGALGTRIDHTFANVFLLEWLFERDVNCIIENEKNIITLIDKKTTITKQKNYISLIALDNEVKINSFTGVKYPLKDYILKRGLTIGVSNEILLDEAKIDISNGKIVVIQSDD